MPTADRRECWNDEVGCLAGRIGVPACSLDRQLPVQHKHPVSGIGEDADSPRLIAIQKSHPIVYFHSAGVELAYFVRQTKGLEKRALD
jgi:hypothetical protein